MYLDIIVDLSDKNLSKVVDVTGKFGYTPRVPVNPHEFIEVSIGSTEDPIKMKAATARPKDLEDIRHLERIKALKGK